LQSLRCASRVQNVESIGSSTSSSWSIGPIGGTSTRARREQGDLPQSKKVVTPAKKVVAPAKKVVTPSKKVVAPAKKVTVVALPAAKKTKKFKLFGRK
jgi:hypothetical protein